MIPDKVQFTVKQFNASIERWISSLDGYTIEMLTTSPGIGSWSLGQVYVHLIADTGYFIEQMKVCLTTFANSDEHMTEEGAILFAHNTFPDMRLTGPSTGITLPQPQSKAQVKERLAAMRDDVNQLHAAYDLSLPSGKTQHPGFQYFNALEWLQFADMHLRHHFRQKDRIDKKLQDSRPL